MNATKETDAATATHADKRYVIDRIVAHTGAGREMALVSVASLVIALISALTMLALGEENAIGWSGVTILGFTTWSARSRAHYHAKARDAAIDEARRG